MASKKKVSRKKVVRKKTAASGKKAAVRKAARKKVTRKKTVSRKKAATSVKKTGRKKKARKKKVRSAAADLRKRAARAESESESAAEVEPAPAGLDTLAMSLGGVQIPNLDLRNMEDTVKGVVNFVEDNPVAAAAMALGAGVVLTSMYWDKVSDSRSKKRR